MLNKLDMSKKLSRKQYDEQLGKAQARLRELGFEIFRRKLPVWCVFEGWDAAGKGGAIKRVAEMLDPRGFTVSTYAAPRGFEKTHHYLWRFWNNVPRAGHMAIFDRSHYGRVLVGMEVPPADQARFRAFLDEVGYPWRDETRNPAYRLFLA